MVPVQWYYAKGGAQLGPVEESELKAKISAGEVGPGDLVWREGMDDWTPAVQVAELVALPTQPAMAASAPGSAVSSPYAPPASQLTVQTSTVPMIPAPCGKATASMVLGICALCFSLCCSPVGLVLGILAVVFGFQANREIDHNPQLVPQRGKAKGGLIMGWIAIGLAVLSSVAGVVLNLTQFGNQFKS